MATTPNLGITLLAASQSQKEVTVNEAILIFDAVVGGGIIDKDLATPPGSPAEGDRYIVAASPTGAWTGKAKNIAFYYNGGWRFIAPAEGIVVWVNDEDIEYVYNGSTWTSGIGAGNMLGINTSADSTNRLAVRSAAILFTAIYAADGGGGDVQVKVNKESAGDNASFLFQTNFSGRAEIGLTGDDNFHFKVSPDGSSWHEAFQISTAGNVGFLGATPAAQQSGGSATAGLVFTATEQAMLQKAYDALRTFGYLS